MRDRPAHFFKQSGVIPYRKRKGSIELMLVSSTSKKRWTIPKGVKERHLTPRHSAAKEALEEAGITGRLSKSSLGSYRYRKWGGTCTVKVYAMEVKKVHKYWQEDFRNREWISQREAMRRIENKHLQRMVKRLPLTVLSG